MTANSLGRTLIGVMGIWLLGDGILLLAQLPFAPFGLIAGGSLPGPMESLMLLSTVGQFFVRPLLGLVLIYFRGNLASMLFGKDEEVSVDTSARDLMALLLFGIGVWYLTSAILNSLSFVEWGPTPYGFPFRLGDYSASYWVIHLLEGVMGAGLILKCGWISLRLAKVVTDE
jgi:hypothetical protein